MLPQFFIFLFVKGVYGDAIRCTPFDALHECSMDLYEFAAPLTKYKFGHFCTQVQEFYDCYDKKYRKSRIVPCGDAAFSLLHNSRHIVEDLCDKSSRTHKGFLFSLPCLINIGDEFTLCDKKLEIMYEKYIRFLHEDFQEKEPPEPLQKCLKVLYRIICIVSKIPKLCGELSHKLFVKLVEHSGTLAMYCTDLDLKDAMIIINLDKAFQRSQKTPVITLKYLFDWLEF